MNRFILVFFFLISIQQTIAQDWLLAPIAQKSDVKEFKNGKVIEISNGLIARQIQISPNAATVSF
jgi:hypothetical protein